MKKIYFSGVFPRMYSAIQLIIDYPPKGYQYIVPENKARTNLLRFSLDSAILKFIYRKILKNIFKTSGWYSKLSSVNIPDDADLVIPCNGLLESNKPYIVLIVDTPLSLSSYDYKRFLKEKSRMEEKFLSHLCKKIIVFNESSLREMKKFFSSAVLAKTVLVRAAVLRQRYFSPKNKSPKITFIGSTGNPEDFYIKGGLEAIESFSRISAEFPNVALTVRCKVPQEIKKKYSSLKNLIILDKPLEYSDWLKVIQNTDIILQPGHVYPLMATLESLSFGKPIIMLDSWGVRDYLTNNKDSILIKPSENIQGYKSEDYPLNIRSKEFIEDIKKLDNRVIEDLAGALRKLIKDKSFREKLGKNGKQKADTKFSIETRNRKLKEIFDEALNSKYRQQ